ncbi:MAG: hypothetical protein KGL35_11530 [Bradyrhizobium sp.]|uniref:hypothetical protein n=1 Tax=Bradyrhizobium sp. TaxID=376 RepID=UPI001C28D24F|nr:hypothetical protein [Bradyrhizobium sp.]MBU6464007.1 hypothetical protein [Pseudomonadota bacterium]MDE2469346.1 hypothetical protein [Bradyrhizobium sp.]
MSGSSSSSSDGWRTASENGNGGGIEKCAITERTILASPVPAIVATLKVGDILAVELDTSSRTRVVVKSHGQIAGAITSARLVDIIECLRNSFSYEAEILSISGGKVEIEIRPQ